MVFPLDRFSRYHRRPSSESKLSPKERWEQGGFLPRMPDSIERLDLLLIHEVRTSKVRTDGIHFHTFRYLSLTLAAYVGEEVTIRFDPRTWAKFASSTMIGSFAEPSRPIWPTRRFRCGRS